MAHNTNRDDQTDLMQDLPDKEQEDLQQNLSDSDQEEP